METEVDKLRLELDDRIKELACLHGISRIAEDPGISLDELLQGIVNLIPLAWSYPETACARIVLENRAFMTKNFKETEWRQSNEITMHDESYGHIDVYYTEERPVRDEGGFSLEERALINTISEYLARIIERKLAEEALRESEERYESLVENTSDGIVIIQDGILKFVNSASLNITGHTPKEMIGGNFLDFVSPEGRGIVMKRYSDRLAGKETPALYEIEILRKDGRVLPVEVNARLIEYQARPADLVFIRDISERKKMITDLKKANEKLKATQTHLIHTEKLASVGILASGVAHEINNPLATITGYAEAIIDEDNSTLMEEYAEKIVDAADRATRVVRWLSKHSREANVGSSALVSLNDVLKDSLESVKLTRSSKNIKLEVDYGDLPLVRGNESEFQQVFVNLINNGTDALPQGGTLAIQTKVERNLIVVTVSDTGEGISEEHSTKIFDPFFTTKEVGQGTGLGLYVVSMIMMKHQGSVEMHSKTGVGTTFTLRFQRGTQTA